MLRDLTHTRKQLELVTALEHALADIDATVGKTLAPIRDSARVLTTLPWVSDLTAQVMVAEIGIDVSRCPLDLLDGSLSAQRRRCRQTSLHAGPQGGSMAENRAGDRGMGCGTGQRLLPASPVPPLALTAWGDNSHPAVAASTAAHHILKNGLPYRDLGADDFSSRDRSKTILRLVRAQRSRLPGAGGLSSRLNRAPVQSFMVDGRASY
jgi:transposase